MYQKLQCTNISSWKKFCLFLVIFFVQFVNGYAQNYVDISLKSIGTNGVETACPNLTGFEQDLVISPNSGLNGKGIGWGANLYLNTETGGSNTIYDLTWIIGSNTTYSGTTYTFDNIDIWMYEYTGVQFPNKSRPDVQTWSSGSMPAGVSNLVKVVSNGKIVLTDVGSECITTTDNALTTPYNYSGNNSLVIYIEKKTVAIVSTGSTGASPVFKHNTRENSTRRICNWEGTLSTPLNSTGNNSAVNKFARVVFNRIKANQKIKKTCDNSPNPEYIEKCAPCTTPVISNKTTSTCSNIALNFTPTATGSDDIPTGTSYKWTFTDNPKVTGEVNETTGKTSITSTLINTTDTPQDVVYTVTPSTGSTCTGTPFTLRVTVNPAPKISNITKSICSGAIFDTVPPSASPNIIPTDTKYTWKVSTPIPTGINDASDQTSPQTKFSQTLTNTTNAPINVIYNVTATSGTSTNQCQGNFDITVTVKPKPATPTLGTPVDPTCALDGSVVISGLPSPLSGSTTWTLKSTLKYSLNAKGNTSNYNYTALKANASIRFIVDLDGCLSDSSALLSVAKIDKPYLEGPTSVCLNSEIELKAWTDKPTAKSVSTPNVTTPWKVKVPGIVDTVSFATGSTSNSSKVKGVKSASSTKPAEVVVEYTDNNGCKAEQTIKVNPLPIIPALSHLPANPLVFTGNKADSVCKGSDIEFALTGGTIGNKVYFKDSLITAPYLIQATNTFKKKNVLSDINILIDSVSNGICRVNAQPIFKITMVDTAFSLKAFPTTNCGTSTGKIDVTTSSIGKLSWANSDLSVVGNKEIDPLTTMPYTIQSLKAGTYTVKFLNGGCELSKTVTVSDPNKPYIEPSLTVNPLSFCNGDSIVLNAWTDKSKATKSIPANTTLTTKPWASNNTNVIFRDTVNPNITPIRVVADVNTTSTSSPEVSSVITYTDINGCSADTTIKIKIAGIPTTITDLVQSFCAADINRVSNLKPVGLIWFDEKGTVELAATTDLKAQFYYAAIKDISTGCFTKKSDRIKVEVKINANPNDPAANPVQTSFCKIDDPEVADLIPAPSSDIKWFLKSGSTLTPQVPTDKLTKEKYVVKKLKDGCLSVNGVEVEVDVISVPKPKAPNQKLCAHNEKPLTLGGLYTSDITNYYFYDLSNASLFPSKIVLDGEQYKVKQSLNGCLSEDTTITIKILDGTSLLTSKYILTPAFCKAENPTLAAIEAKYSALPTSGSIFWYDAQNSSLTNDLSKTADLGGTAYSLWIAVKDENGCFSKKQQVDFTIDPGKKPDLKPIELCKTTDYTLTNLDVANISNPKGTLTWYLSQTGVGLAPPTVPKNSSQKYWASYKETATSCEGERKDLNINWIDLSQPFSIDFKNQKFCKTANKTVDDLNPAPFTDANIAWFENTSTNIPYPAIDLLADKIYYASQYQITSAGDYCVNPNRIPVNVALYSNKIYPIVKESVCSKQNGSIEFINPPAGLTFDWYEQSNPTTLDFTGAKYTKPLEKQSFKIKIKDSFGCEEEVSVSLPECSDSPIPQILSPNNDAYNNKWVINYSGKYKNVQVRIFNRWGNEVFTSAIPYKDDWDGKRNNEYLPSGTYYYVIDKGNGDPIESGYIELIK